MSNLKAVGLVAVVVLAVSAAWASAAQAAAPEFHCTSESATCFVTSSGGSHGTGSNDHEFITESGTITCTGNAEVDGVQLKGTLAEKTTTTLTFEATYTGCKAFGVSATVSAEGCTYKLHLVEGGTTPFPVKTDVVCPEGKAIKITPSGKACTVTIGAQTGLTGITMINSPGTHVSTNAAVTGISYTETGAECKAAGAHANGKFNGSATWTAFEDIAGVEGPKVPIHVGVGATQEPTFHCTATTANCIFSGASTNTHTLTTTAGTVKCKGTTLTGTTPKTAFMVGLEPVYKECTAFGQAATVSAEGCYYWVELKSGGTSPYPATTDIFCPAGKQITVNVPTASCTVKIGEQTGLAGLTFVNSGVEPTLLSGTASLSKITYTASGGICGSGTGTNGTYAGTFSLSGFEDSGGTKGKNVGLHIF